MKKTLLLLFWVVALSTQTINAQVKVHEKGSTSVQHNSNRSKGVWKFKVDPYEAILAGTAKFYVEKSFGETFSLELGGGFTYNSLMNAFMFETFKSGSDGNFFYGSVKTFNPPSAKDNYSPIDDKNAKIGYSFSAMPKVYFDEDPTDGFFLGLLLDYKNYAYDFNYNNSKLPYNFTKFNTFLVFGTTRNFGNNFFIESLMGLGPNFVKDQRYIKYYNSTSGNYQLGTVKMSDVRFGFYAGLRFGVYFD